MYELSMTTDYFKFEAKQIISIYKLPLIFRFLGFTDVAIICYNPVYV